MYRDVKPDNVGFDIYGNIKLFDFGLARELENNHKNEQRLLYNYTSFVGTPRYMEPHIALGQPYNELCDVYSFSILFWEILQLQLPFAGYTMATRMERVVHGGERPPIKESWPSAFKKLLRSGFGDMTYRINMKDVCEIIGDELKALTSTNVKLRIRVP
jgi:serine/threonine protein kinase